MLLYVTGYSEKIFMKKLTLILLLSISFYSVEIIADLSSARASCKDEINKINEEKALKDKKDNKDKKSKKSRKDGPSWDPQYQVRIPIFEICHFKAGDDYYKSGNYERAYQEYFMTTRLNPSFWQGFRGIGNVYLKQNREVKAINNYLKAIAIVNPTYAAKTLDEGKIAMKEGDFYLAIAKFQKILAIPPDSGRLVDEGVELLKENKKSAAQKKFEEAIKMEEAAREEAKKIGIDISYYADAHFKLAGMNYEKKKFPEAIKDYEKAVEFDPSEFAYHYSLGNAYYKQALKNKKKLDRQYLAKAINSYKKAHELNQRDVDTMFNLGSAIVDMAGVDVSGAKSDKKTAATSNEDIKASKYAVALMEKSLKGTVEAVSLLEKVTNANPKDAQAHVILGDAYVIIGSKPEHFMKAIEEYEKAMLLDSNKTDLYYKIGIAYYIASTIYPNTEELPITKANAKLYVKFGKKFYKADMLESSRENFNSYNVYNLRGKNRSDVNTYLVTINKEINSLGFRIPDKATGR